MTSAMPLFGRKQSKEAKKRLDHLLYQAEESPEPIIDVSNCELTEVPAGLYSMCNVFRKESLIMHTNYLSSFRGGGDLALLSNIKILDVHENTFSHMPEEIGKLKSVQVLDLHDNKLQKLPASMGNLHSLQTLNVKGNNLKELPLEICSLKSLRLLDLSFNKIKVLPRNFYFLKTLESLVLDSSQMEFPPHDICINGTEAIMRHLCTVAGVEYSPPSKYLLNLVNVSTSQPNENSATKLSLKMLQDEDDKLNATLDKYEELKKKKISHQLELEHQLAESDKEQAELEARLAQEKKQTLYLLSKEESNLENKIRLQQQRMEMDKQNMLADMRKAEQTSDQLLKQLLEINERTRKDEELLEKLEKERLEFEETFKIATEDRHILRKEELVELMKTMLEESNSLEHLRQTYEANKQKTTNQVQESEIEEEEQFFKNLVKKQTSHDKAVKDILNEELLQMKAFENLQLEKDMQHQRIITEISLIEQQLAGLTLAELNKEKIKTEREKELLNQQREELAKLMMCLIEQKEQREMELKKRLFEMERRREDESVDYWLVKFQRLLDRKPQALMDREHNLEVSVVQILKQAGAEDYIHKFARHYVSIESLLQMTEEDLKQMGVHEIGLRKALLKAIQNYSAMEQKASQKNKALDGGRDKGIAGKSADGPVGAAVASASSPSPSLPLPSALIPPPAVPLPSAPPLEITAHSTYDCVVCMDAEANMVFLNCGHVCCCQPCSKDIHRCPMCRADIVTRVRLSKKP